MAEIINTIAQFIQSLIITVGYPGIFAMQFAENIFPPIPTDGLLPFSGVVAASGRLNIVGVWLAAVLGSLVGSLVLYAVGKWADERVIRNLVRRYGRFVAISDTEIDRVLNWFNRYGVLVIVFGRLLPVMRTGISLTAGMSKMPVLVFAGLTTLSSACAMVVWIGVGYILGENWRIILTLVDEFEPYILLMGGVLLVIVVLFTVRRFARGRHYGLREISSSAE